MKTFPAIVTLLVVACGVVGVTGGVLDNPEDLARHFETCGKLTWVNFQLKEKEFRNVNATHGKFDSLEIYNLQIKSFGKVNISNVVKKGDIYEATLSGIKRLEIYGLANFVYQPNSGDRTSKKKVFITEVTVPFLDKPLQFELTFKPKYVDTERYGTDVILKSLQMSKSSHQSATYTTKLAKKGDDYKTISACHTVGNMIAHHGEMHMCQDVVDFVTSKLKAIDRFDIKP